MSERRESAVSTLPVFCALVLLTACGPTSNEAADDAPTPSQTVTSLPADGSTESKVPSLPPALPSGSVPSERNPLRSYSHADRTSDVIAIHGGQHQEEARAAPNLTISDIRSSRMEHTGSQVKVSLKFVDLLLPQIEFPPLFQIHVTVRNSTGDNHQVLLVFGYKSPKVTLESHGRTVACDIVRSIDPRTDLVTIGIPRECLGEPVWVRISLMSMAYVHDLAETIAWDHALNKGPGPRTGADRFSPPIHAPG